MYVQATCQMPYWPQDSNKRPPPLWSTVFITAIKKKISLPDWKKFTDTSKGCETTDILHYWPLAAYWSLCALWGLQTHETSLTTYCTVYIKTIFTHTHTHTYIHITLMKATNYEVSHNVLYNYYFISLSCANNFLSTPSSPNPIILPSHCRKIRVPVPIDHRIKSG